MSHTTSTDPAGRRITPPLLLWLTLFFVAVWHVGAHVDVRYHLYHGFEIESFFVWTHALIQAGAAGTALVIVAYVVESYRRGIPPSERLPPGFQLILLGTLLFALGAPLDALWHDVAGFEVDFDALVSPAHLWLLFAHALALAGLLRASVDYRPRPGVTIRFLGWRDLPLVLCLAMLLRIILWSLSYSEPFIVDYPASEPIVTDIPALEVVERESATGVIAGYTGILIHSALLALFLTATLRNLLLPAGAVLLIMTLNWVYTWYLPAAVGAAVVAEGLWAVVRSGRLGGPHGRAGYWTIAFVVPMAEITFYLLIIWFVGGIHWSTHVWAGTPILAGCYGLIASLLAVPPRFLRFSHRTGDS